MKYCNHCGEKIEDNIRYCPKCGTEQQITTVHNSSDSKKRNVLIIAGVVLTVVIIIAAIIVTILLSRQSSDSHVAQATTEATTEQQTTEVPTTEEPTTEEATTEESKKEKKAKKKKKSSSSSTSSKSTSGGTGYYTVKVKEGTYLALRSTPETRDDNIEGKLYNGQTVQVDSVNGNFAWVYSEDLEQSGYVNADYLWAE